jgi:hypothetical protein
MYHNEGPSETYCNLIAFCISSIIMYFFFLWYWGLNSRSCLQGRYSYHLNHVLQLFFALVSFWIGSCILICLGLWPFAYLMPSSSWNYKGVSPYLVVWDEGLANFLHKLVSKHGPPISTSQVAGITDVIHHAWPWYVFFYWKKWT